MGLSPTPNRHNHSLAPGPNFGVRLIGQPGEFIQFFLGNDNFVFRFANAICNSLDAAIVLENCGGTLGPQGVPVQPNVIQNNKIGEEDFAAAAPNQLGIRLQGQSELNVIGGPANALGNRVYYNFDVGIQFSNVISSSLEHRNRVENNRVTQTGKVRQINVGGPPLPPPPSRLGYGIQIVDPPNAKSYAQQVGEDGFSANTLDLNQFGVMVHNGAQRHLVSFHILNNFIAGVVLSNVTDSAIGSDGFRQGNRVELNGRGNPGEGGIILSGGASNRIQGNRIGQLKAGNQGPGIFIHNSHRNLIGGGPRLTGNQILANTSHGIHLSGAGTLFTFVQNNLIGIAPDRSPAPNLGDGILLSGGASKNLVGGETLVPPDGPGATLVQVPNDIAYNSGAGVRVDGAASLANSILYNSITKHPGNGIILSNGGNREEPPPLWVSLVGGEVFGKMLNPLVHPPGTLIQIFSDDDPLFPEGDEWLGDAVVDLNGNWSAPLTKPINHPLLSMTATRAGDLSTSEFGNRVIITNSELSRLEVTTNISQSPVAAAPGANQVPLFKLRLSTLNLDYAVDHITLEAIGSLQDATSIHSVWVFDDANRNNQIDESDLLLGLRTGWPSNDGVARIDLVGAKIPADSQRFWIVAISLNGSAVAGQKLSFRMRSPQDWGARYILPFGAPTQVVGVHPLNSATLTVGTTTPQSYASWRSSAFTPSQLLDPKISGPNADPDGDGLCNLQEYAFNLNPRVADSQRLEENGSKGSPRPGSVLLFEPAQNGGAEFLTVTFLRRKAPSDLNYAVDWSPDLAQWLGSQAQPEPLTLLDQRDVPGLVSMEQVSYRTTAPMSGIAPAPKQFLRVAVSLTTP